MPRVAKTDLDKIVMRSRCSFREFNDRTGQMTPMPADGDTGYLWAGTPVYAIRGWSPACRFAAQHDGEFRVYLARAAALAFRGLLEENLLTEPSNDRRDDWTVGQEAGCRTS